jgi:Peptidase family M48
VVVGHTDRLWSEGVAGFQDMGREALAQLDGRLQQPSRMPAERQAALGLLAHEIGHVEHRHGTRMLIEQGVINIGMGLALGDVSSLVFLGVRCLPGWPTSAHTSRRPTASPSL